MKSFQRGPSITECRASLFTTRCVACSGRFLVRVTNDTHFVSVCQQHYYQSALLRSSVLLNACDDNLLWHVVSRSSSPVAKPTKTGARGYKCGCSRCCIHDRYVFPSYTHYVSLIVALVVRLHTRHGARPFTLRLSCYYQHPATHRKFQSLCPCSSLPTHTLCRVSMQRAI